jgi:hypothetical protein
LANMLYCGFMIIPTQLRKLRDSITPRVRELIIVVGIQFLIDTFSALGSMLKDSCNMVDN